MLEAVKSTDAIHPLLLAAELGFSPAQLRWFKARDLESDLNAAAAEELEALEASAAQRTATPSARLPVLACLTLTVLMLLGLPVLKLALQPRAPDGAEAAPSMIHPSAIVRARVLEPAALKAKAKLVRAELNLNAALAALEKEKARSKHKASVAVRRAEAKLKASRADAQKARSELLAAGR